MWSIFKKWLVNLFHVHDWDIIEAKRIYVHADNDLNSIPTYHKYLFIQQCKTCGKIKCYKFNSK